MASKVLAIRLGPGAVAMYAGAEFSSHAGANLAIEPGEDLGLLTGCC